jgi:hypothetical protein
LHDRYFDQIFSYKSNYIDFMLNPNNQATEAQFNFLPIQFKEVMYPFY